MAHLTQYFFPTGVRGVAIQRRQIKKKKKKEKKKGEKKTVQLSYCCTSSACTLVDFQDVAFCTEYVESSYQGWRLSQSYHTCSYHEGDRSWIEIATKGQGLGFMSRSEDISPIYSCAGAKPSTESSEQAAQASLSPRTGQYH